MRVIIHKPQTSWKGHPKEMLHFFLWKVSGNDGNSQILVPVHF